MDDQNQISDQETTQPISDAEKKKDTVAYETYRRTLNEAKTAKEKLRELEAWKAQQEEEKLKANNEWKALAESKDKTLSETMRKLSELETTIDNSVKLNAFNRYLNGKVRHPDYYSFVDTSKIALNPETRQVDEASVKEVVSEFLKNHSHLVEFKGGKLPNEAASGANFSGQKKIEEMSASELEKHIKSLHEKGLLK